MSISMRDRRLLYYASGGLCAFPSCQRSLIAPGAPGAGAVNVGEEAHIVARELDGPRGDYPLPLEERDRYENLVLLCTEHHKRIDDKAQVPYFTVERLRQIKADHEEQVAEMRRRVAATREARHVHSIDVNETLHGSFFRVDRLPPLIYSLEYSDSERSVRDRLVRARDESELSPYIVRGNRLYAFNNPARDDSVFRDIAQGQSVEQEESEAWWDDDDRMRWFQDLLNRVLNKITGRLDLNLDRAHKRFFFEPIARGKERTVSYQSMMRREHRQVVWQPITKKTGEPKRFWYHRAVALRFVRVGRNSWCLTLRPELRVTRDGCEPLESEKIGSRVTKKLARNFNDVELRDVQFWRDYLFQSEPRIIAAFGPGQAVVVDSSLVTFDVRWPGVPQERALEFQNAVYEDNLFTMSMLDQIDTDEEDVAESYEEDCDDMGS